MMPAYAPILQEGPEALPVSLEEVKAHLRVDATDEDSLIGIYRDAAIAHLDGPEGWLRRAIVTQTWSQDFDAFARCLRLGLAPVAEISSVVYLDASGDEQTVDADEYVLINPKNAPEVRFVEAFSFPTARDDRPVLTVTFVAGYGDPAAVPAALKAAILLMVGDMYETREAKVKNDLMENSTVRRLLDPYRRGWIA